MSVEHIRISYIVSYPVFGEVEVPTKLSKTERQDRILDHADDLFFRSSVKPVIVDCSDERLIQ